MYRYLPLMDSIICLRLVETSDGESSIAASAAVNSRRSVGSKHRTASTIACTCSDMTNPPIEIITDQDEDGTERFCQVQGEFQTRVHNHLQGANLTQQSSLAFRLPIPSPYVPSKR